MRERKAVWIMSDLITSESNATSGDQDDVGVDVTAVMRIKHAGLWSAAKSLGGCKQLAEHLGVTVKDIYDWINMDRVPPPGPSTGKWTEEFWYSFEAKLFALTGETMEQLFPESLRSNKAFLTANKTAEKTARLSQVAMLNYADATRQRMIAADQKTQGKMEEMRAAIFKTLRALTYREREVIKLRYGLDGPERTLEETAKLFGVGKERIRQIEAKAMRKMQLRKEDLREVIVEE